MSNENIVFSIYLTIAILITIGFGIYNHKHDKLGNDDDGISLLIVIASFFWPLIIICLIFISPYYIGVYIGKFLSKIRIRF